MKLNGQNPNLDAIRSLYLTAFPLCERKPFSVIEEKQKAGFMEILSIEEEDGTFLGLALTALFEDLALLDYFAVADDRRNRGVGAEALRLLQKRYEDKRLFIEIETTEGESDNREERIRRKSFYLRNNMVPLPYVVNLFGVEMEMLSAGGKMIRFAEYHRMYEEVFHKSKFVKLVREL